MDPILGGLITGGASLLGSIFSSNTANQNNQANIAAAANQNLVNQNFAANMQKDAQNFSAQMSNTAYQRASADMQLAGLNPAMMFGSGGAASTPGAGIASAGTTVPQHSQTNPLAGIGQAVGNAMTGAVQMKLMDKQTDEMANLVQENELLKKKIELTQGYSAKTAQETKTEEHRTDAEAARAGLLQQQLPAARVGAREAGGVESLPDDVLRTMGIVKYGAGAASKVMDVLSPAARIIQGHSALKFQQGNFIGRYGVPIDEYLAQ